jgi:Protein of unknown function (DUF3579)
MSATREPAHLVIDGITDDGQTFRPSDWIERLIDTACAFGPERRLNRKGYSGPERRQQQVTFLQAQMVAGRKCLVVDVRLREANPAAFDFVLQFVRSNHLRCLEITTNTAPPAEPRLGSDAGPAE